MKLSYFLLSILGVLLIIIYYNINPSEVDFLPKCPLYVTTGFYCPGCGSQRATHQLLNFNLIGVVQQNALFLFSLAIFGYHLFVSGINLYFKKNIYNYLNHPKTPIVILVIVILFWILRNLPFYPFNILAPN